MSASSPPTTVGTTDATSPIASASTADSIGSSSAASATSSAATASASAGATENPIPVAAASSGSTTDSLATASTSPVDDRGGLLSLLGLGSGPISVAPPTPPSPPPSYPYDGGLYTGAFKEAPPPSAAASSTSASATAASADSSSSSPVTPLPSAIIPHGRGKLKLPSGVEVSGEWCDGVLSVGVLTNAAASESLHYEGQLHHYTRHGKGMEWRLEDGEINRWGKWDNNILIAEAPVPRAVITEGAFLAQEDMLSKLEFILADGTAARYEGARNAANEPHGTGVMYNAKNEAVRGDTWLDGAQDGEGYFIHVDGEKYTGHFKSGFKHGPGSHYFPDGELYEGQFRFNRKHGMGKQRWDDGYIYEGMWAHDEQNGWGIEYTKSGKISACGKWKDSELKEWHAVPRSVIPIGTYLSEKAKTADLLYSDGGYYKGEVNSNQEAHGKGILYTATSSIVQGGLFQHGKLHGEGFTNHPDGGRYSGEHRAGLREGFGKLSLANGDKYVGAFHNNLQHGRGIYTWAKGDVYDGNWSDVRMHGIGKYSWPDGIVYLGEWVLGLQTGLGFKWSGLGTRPQFGRWLDNKLIHSLWVSPPLLAKMPSWTVEEFKAELEGKWAEMAKNSAVQTAKIQRATTNAVVKKANGTNANNLPCTCTCKQKPCTCGCACERCVHSRRLTTCHLHPNSSSTPSDEWSAEVYDLIVKMRTQMEPHAFFQKHTNIQANNSTTANR